MGWTTQRAASRAEPPTWVERVLRFAPPWAPAGRPPAAEPTTASPLFDATRWSLVQRARDDSVTALNDLFTRYRQPLLKRLRAQGFPPDDAEDLVQGFCAQLLRRDFLANVAPAKGRFRTWLLNALDNYLRDEHDRRQTLKRGQGVAPESLNETDGHGRTILDPPADTAAADLEYDQEWARTVLANALAQVARESASTGHTALFTALEPALFADETSLSYREIATRLGMSEGHVKVTAHRIRRRLAALIREAVLQTVDSESEWEDELRHLISLFRR